MQFFVITTVLTDCRGHWRVLLLLCGYELHGLLVLSGVLFLDVVGQASCSRPFLVVAVSGRLLWYGLGRPVVTSEIGNWSVFVLLGWRFVFGIIIKRDGREPRIVRCHHDSGNNKAASLLRLLSSKVSNHHGLAK